MPLVGIYDTDEYIKLLSDTPILNRLYARIVK